MDNKEKRRRRKAIKSCAFCRRRKLRCDQKRPRCSTCIARKLPECVYSHDGQPTETQQARKLIPLPTFGGSNSTYNITSDPLGSGSRNLLGDFFTLHCKESGQRLYYGPTSVKTLMAKFDPGLLDRFRQATGKVREVRHAWKKKTGFSMLTELTVYDAPHNIQEIVSALPSYETILRCVDTFFEDSLLYPQNDAFDKQKVLRDLQEGLVLDVQVTPGRETAVVALKAGPKFNYYRLGVVFSILALTHYHGDLPMPLEAFYVFLTGCSSAKNLHIERCQTFLLRCCYRLSYGFHGGDNTHLMLMVDNMVDTAVYLGLHTDICVLYRGQESSVGSLESLQALWHWIVFADFDIALNVGRNLKIPLGDYEVPFGNYSDTVYGVMARFLKIARPIICDVHNKRRTPDFSVHCEIILAFIEEEFSPLELYTNDKLMQQQRLPHMRVLCEALALLICCYGLRSLALKESSVSVKNSAMKVILIVFSLCSSWCKFCYEIDKLKSPHMMGANCKHMSPYLTSAVSSWYTLFLRAMVMFYGFAHSEMTLFESGLLFLQSSDMTDECDLSNIRCQGNNTIAFSTYFKIASEKLDALTASDNPAMKMVLRRSITYVLLMGMDKVFRALVRTALESRTNAETSWLSNSKEHQSPVTSGLQSPKEGVRSTPQGEYKGSDIIEPNTFNSNEIKAEQENLLANQLTDSQMEAETAQMMAEEFWQSYNIGWQGVLDSAEAQELISDFMM